MERVALERRVVLKQDVGSVVGLQNIGGNKVGAILANVRFPDDIDRGAVLPR